MINLYDILDAADGQLFGDPTAQIFNGFSIDFRHVQEGDLFVAIKTELGDGHHFMEEAVNRGATGIMCTHPPTFDTEGITVMIMRDVQGALMRWTKYILTKHGTTVVAIAGNDGKSTTKEAMARVLSTKYQVYNGVSDIGGRFGLPLALGKLTSQHDLALLEFNSKQAGEMAEMIDAAYPTVGVVTNLADSRRRGAFSEAHILIENLPEDGLAILNYDDQRIRQMRSKAASLTVSVDRDGTSFGADLIAYNIIVSIDKTGFDLRYGTDRHIAKWVPLLGAHQLYAVMAALATGLAFSVPLEESLRIVTELTPLPGRMRAFQGHNDALLIDDTYGASPESLLAALDWLDSVRPRTSAIETEIGQVSPHGKIYVVLGDISDNGTAHQISYHDIGRRLDEVAGVIITEGDSAALAARAALENGFPLAMTHITYSTQDAVSAIKDKISAKDLVLIKGGQVARMERVVAQLLNNPEERRLLPRTVNEADADVIDQSTRSTWVQLNMNAIASNVRLLKETIGPDVCLMAVVKADAYGHGAIPVSTTAVLNGADYLGVASLSEAQELRRAGITAPILIMGFAPSYAARQVVGQDISVTIYDLANARVFNRAAAELRRTLKVHIRIDIGASGLGVMPEEVPAFFRGLMRLSNLKIEGVYTHLGDGTNRKDLILDQHEHFEEVFTMLRAAEFDFKYIHAASTAAVFQLPETRYNMVRCGLAIYGMQPSVETPLPAEFQPALTWKTTVAQVKRVPAGTLVGYGGAFETTRPQTLAILPIGIGDGFRHGPDSWREVLINGQRAPVVGSVSMYQTLVDVTKIGDVRVGDEVVLLGQQGEERITTEDVADMLNTINYEVISSISSNVPRLKV